jgi:hypothetical protein
MVIFTAGIGLDFESRAHLTSFHIPLHNIIYNNVAYRPVAKRRLCKQRQFLGNGSVNTFPLLGIDF